LIGSYCQPEEVTALLAGYDLSRLGDAQAVAARRGALLPMTRQAVEAAAGHDFFRHSGEMLALDGSGTDRLSLVAAGRVPLLGVEAVSVGGQALAPGSWVVYAQAGEIRLAGGARFPVGQQNVSVTLDWGYAQPPAEVGLAQAKLTAAEILAEAMGEAASAQSMALGDYAVRYAAAGQYGAVIRRLVAEARELLRPHRRVGMRAV